MAADHGRPDPGSRDGGGRAHRPQDAGGPGAGGPGADGPDADGPAARGPDAEGRRLIALLLRVGLAAAAALLVAGVVLKGLAGDLSAPAVPRGALLTAPSLGDTLLSLGVLVLAATPFVRVLALTAVWVRVRDWRFVATAGAVLVLLVAAAMLGGG